MVLLPLCSRLLSPGSFLGLLTCQVFIYLKAQFDPLFFSPDCFTVLNIKYKLVIHIHTYIQVFVCVCVHPDFALDFALEFVFPHPTDLRTRMLRSHIPNQIPAPL